MKKNQANFLISLDVYPYSILVSLNQTKKQLRKHIKKYQGIDLKEFDKYTKGKYGGIMLCFNSKSHLIHLPHYDGGPQDLSILVHEVWHCAYSILKFVGIYPTNDTNEAYAYLIECILFKILQRIKEDGIL